MFMDLIWLGTLKQNLKVFYKFDHTAVYLIMNSDISSYCDEHLNFKVSKLLWFLKESPFYLDEEGFKRWLLIMLPVLHTFNGLLLHSAVLLFILFFNSIYFSTVSDNTQDWCKSIDCKIFIL